MLGTAAIGGGGGGDDDDDLALADNHVSDLLPRFPDGDLRLPGLDSGEGVIYRVPIDDRRVLTAFRDLTIKLWNSFGECERTVPTIWTSSVRLTPLAFHSATPGLAVKAWSIDDSMLRCIISGLAGYANLVTVNPNGHMCVTGRKDGIKLLWDLKKRHRMYRVFERDALISFFFNDERLWLGAALKGSLTIWDLKSSAVIFAYNAGPPFRMSEDKGRPVSTTEGWPSSMSLWTKFDGLVLECIMDHLTIIGGHRFGAACKGFWKVSQGSIHSFVQFPWLVLPGQTTKLRTRNVYSPSDGVTFQMHTPLAALRKHCCASYHGWLLMANYNDNFDVFLYNPLTGRVVDFPRVGFFLGLLNAYWTSSPTSPDCILVYPTPENSVLLCRVGEKKWTEYARSAGYIVGITSLDDKLYCICNKKHLMVIEPSVAKVIRLLPMENSEILAAKNGRREHTFIVESLGELLMVIVAGEKGSWVIEPDLSTPDFEVHVFKADLSKMVWTRVRSLGDRVLFLGRGCSTSLSAAEIGSRGNRVYFIGAMFQLREMRQHYGQIPYWCWLEMDLGTGKGRYCTPPAPLDYICPDGHSLWLVPNYTSGRN